jgi:hypothetical protein
MQDANKLDAAFAGPVKNQVVLETVDGPDSNPCQATIGRLPQTGHLRHPSKALKCVLGSIKKTQRRFETVLGDEIREIQQILVDDLRAHYPRCHRAVISGCLSLQSLPQTFPIRGCHLTSLTSLQSTDSDQQLLIDLCPFQLYLCFSEKSGNVVTRAVKATGRDLGVDELLHRLQQRDGNGARPPVCRVGDIGNGCQQHSGPTGGHPAFLSADAPSTLQFPIHNFQFAMLGI